MAKKHILSSERTNLDLKLKNKCGMLPSIFNVEQSFQRYLPKTRKMPPKIIKKCLKLHILNSGDPIGKQ